MPGGSSGGSAAASCRNGIPGAYAAMDERRAIKTLIRIGTRETRMSKWTGDQLDKVGKAEEVQVASVRRNGAFGKPVTVWVVRHGDDLYLRSVKGPSAHWFRGTQERHEGRIRAGRFGQRLMEDPDVVEGP